MRSGRRSGGRIGGKIPTVNDVFVYLFYAMIGLLVIAALGAQVLLFLERVEEDRQRIKGTWRERLKEDFERRAAAIPPASRWLGLTGIVVMAGALLLWHQVPVEEPPATEEHFAVLGFFLGMLLTTPLLYGALRASLGSITATERNRRDS